jgi:site-specific DNA-methyltransferase (cytosine-N4-specific)
MDKDIEKKLEIKPLYATRLGGAFCGDALHLTARLPDEFVDLIVTSPPFALRRKKAYDNVDAGKYVKWFMPFAQEFYRVLKPEGSLVLHLGGSWTEKSPVKSLYTFELLLRLCKELHFNLAQDVYWFNKAKLPGPAEWVTIRKCRLKDAVDYLWWLSKTPYPKANNTYVLKEYSKSMKELLANPNYYKVNVKRPSEHVVSRNFHRKNKGAIPANFLDFPNTDSNSRYLRMCREHGVSPHPARFPLKIPLFFIKFLTNEGDLVLDPFGGSNTTGEAAERLRRHWLTFETSEAYLEASKFRFVDLCDYKIKKPQVING